MTGSGHPDGGDYVAGSLHTGNVRGRLACYGFPRVLDAIDKMAIGLLDADPEMDGAEILDEITQRYADLEARARRAEAELAEVKAERDELERQVRDAIHVSLQAIREREDAVRNGERAAQSHASRIAHITAQRDSAVANLANGAPGIVDDCDEMCVPTPEQLVARFWAWSLERQVEFMADKLEVAERAQRCFILNHEGELAHLRDVCQVAQEPDTDTDAPGSSVAADFPAVQGEVGPECQPEVAGGSGARTGGAA